MEVTDKIPVFRAPKRRKIFRRPSQDEDAIDFTPDGPSPPNQASEEALDDDGPSLAEILRRRKQKKPRKTVVDVLDVSAKPVDRKTTDMNAVAPTKGRSAIEVMNSRFVSQTGLVKDVDDKEMDAYIEARMAEKYQHLNAPTKPATLPIHPTAPLQIEKLTRELNDDSRNATSSGKLHEVDLGPDATARNVKRTEEARLKLEGNVVDSGDNKPTGKVRLGPDGKPWRGRKRRNSEDIRRDEIVEQILRESRLDLYEQPKESSPIAGNDQDADDAMEQQFRREYFDQMEERNQQQQRKPPTVPGPRGAKQEPSKGPKLGGSRSARAQMRLLEEQKEKQKQR